MKTDGKHFSNTLRNGRFKIMKKYSMLTDSPGKSLFFFALPMILGNLFQQFYSTVDSIIVGKFVGEAALAAVGASYSLTTVFIMIAIGGGIGASVLVCAFHLHLPSCFWEIGYYQYSRELENLYGNGNIFQRQSYSISREGEGRCWKNRPGYL